MRSGLNWIVRIFGVLLGLVVLLFATAQLFPHAILWLFAERPPTIVALTRSEILATKGTQVDHDRHLLLLVQREFPEVVSVSGLMAELKREGFSIDSPHHHADAHWSDAACENFFGLDWQANRIGKVEKIRTEWQAGCTP